MAGFENLLNFLPWQAVNFGEHGKSLNDLRKILKAQAL